MDEFAHLADAARFPGPELRADEVNDGDTEAVKLFSEAEMDFGEIDEHGQGGPAGAEGALELAELAIDAGQMPRHLSESHDRHVFRAGHDLDSGGGHARAAHSEQLRCFTSWSEVLPEGSGQKRPVELAA